MTASIRVVRISGVAVANLIESLADSFEDNEDEVGSKFELGPFFGSLFIWLDVFDVTIL